MRYSVPALHHASVVPACVGGVGGRPQEFRKSDLEGQGPHITVQVGSKEGPSQPAPPPPTATTSSCQLWGGPSGRLAVNPSWDVHFPHLPSRGLGLWASLDQHRTGGVCRLQKDPGPSASSQRPCPPPQHEARLPLLFRSVASVSASLPRWTEGRGRTPGTCVSTLCSRRFLSSGPWIHNPGEPGVCSQLLVESTLELPSSPRNQIPVSRSPTQPNPWRLFLFFFFFKKAAMLSFLSTNFSEASFKAGRMHRTHESIHNLPRQVEIFKKVSLFGPLLLWGKVRGGGVVRVCRNWKQEPLIPGRV